MRVWEVSEPWLLVFAQLAQDPSVLLAELPAWARLLDRHSSVEVRPPDATRSVIWSNAPGFPPEASECEFRLGALRALLVELLVRRAGARLPRRVRGARRRSLLLRDSRLDPVPRRPPRARAARGEPAADRPRGPRGAAAPPRGVRRPARPVPRRARAAGRAALHGRGRGHHPRVRSRADGARREPRGAALSTACRWPSCAASPRRTCSRTRPGSRSASSCRACSRSAAMRGIQVEARTRTGIGDARGLRARVGERRVDRLHRARHHRAPAPRARARRAQRAAAGAERADRRRGPDEVGVPGQREPRAHHAAHQHQGLRDAAARRRRGRGRRAARGSAPRSARSSWAWSSARPRA